MLDDLLGRLSSLFGKSSVNTVEETPDLTEFGIEGELLEEFLSDIDEEVNDEPQPHLGEISDIELEREIARDAGVEVDDEEISRRNGCEEIVIISEINVDLKSEIAEPHEEILDEMGELDDEEIAEEIADELKNDQEETAKEWQDEVEEKEVLQDILEELREDIEGEDYVPTFESEQLEFEDEEKDIGKA